MCPLGLGFKRLQSAEHFRGGATHLILYLRLLLAQETHSHRIGVPLSPRCTAQSQHGQHPWATPRLKSSCHGCRCRRPWRTPLVPSSRGSGVYLAITYGSLTPLPSFLLHEVTVNLYRTTSGPQLGKVPKVIPQGEIHQGWLCGG